MSYRRVLPEEMLSCFDSCFFKVTYPYMRLLFLVFFSEAAAVACNSWPALMRAVDLFSENIFNRRVFLLRNAPCHNELRPSCLRR